jgi:hypothetical protein
MKRRTELELSPTDRAVTQGWEVRAMKTAAPKRRFRGVLTTLDSPSAKPPAGSCGHRVLLPRRVAENALESLIGVGICFASTLDRHDPRRKVGVITKAEIADNTVMIEGHLWEHDFPEVVARIHAQADTLGMSYEIADASVVDIREKVWRLSRVTFTGAAIILEKKAAYRGTSITLLRANVEE